MPADGAPPGGQAEAKAAFVRRLGAEKQFALVTAETTGSCWPPPRLASPSSRKRAPRRNVSSRPVWSAGTSGTRSTSCAFLRLTATLRG